MDSSPVCIVKDGLVLPIESLKDVKAPFNFRISGKGFFDLDGSEKKEFHVVPGDQVVYFQRKRMRIHRGRVVANFIYRICIGVIKLDGTDIRHWISPDGDYIEPNLEPVKKV